MSTPRIRIVEDGALIDVPNDHPRGALRIESGRGSKVRLVLDEQTLAWSSVLRWYTGIAWARAEPDALAIVPPIRASEARRIEDWPARFAELLARSARTWLRPGRWALSLFDRRAHDYVSRDLDVMPASARKLEEALDLPASFVEPYRLDGSGRVLALRSTSPIESARVKSWRKHAREGTLPPILLGWISALDVYVILDGHDRLRAAQLEQITPEVVGLYGVRDAREPWSEADRDRARADALERYERVFASEPRLSDRTRIEANERLVGAWGDYHRTRSGTTARYRGDLAERFREELASRVLPDDVRAALCG